MVNQAKNPCEECIVKMICSKDNCERKRKYEHYSFQFNIMERELRNQKSQMVVDSYFKRFRRNR